MPDTEIAELQRVFLTRLDALEHILDVGEKHLPDLVTALQHERLAPDMFPLGTQFAFACNQPRGFSQWCAGQPVENLAREAWTVELVRSHIHNSKELVAAIDATDAKLDEIKRVGLGPDAYCELPGRQYISEYLLPNFYFHITTAYAILRQLGAPLGKADYMTFLAPLVKHAAGA